MVLPGVPWGLFRNHTKHFFSIDSLFLFSLSLSSISPLLFLLSLSYLFFASFFYLFLSACYSTSLSLLLFFSLSLSLSLFLSEYLFSFSLPHLSKDLPGISGNALTQLLPSFCRHHWSSEKMLSARLWKPSMKLYFCLVALVRWPRNLASILSEAVVGSNLGASWLRLQLTAATDTKNFLN